jgi:endonuclease/exonuclease/phosphatase (EEP) superfamily protein YafD
MTFLLWNLKGKDLSTELDELTRQHRPDVLILLESQATDGKILAALNSTHGSAYHLPRTLCRSVRIYTSFPRRFITPLSESHRYTIRRIALPLKPEILLVAVHLPSRLHWRAASQSMECVELSREIQDAERKAKHTRTILLGDLNANPFDDGLVSANGLNAVMTRTIAARGSKTVQSRQFPFFYNPMWGHFGDRVDGPAGTYYYEHGEHVGYYWNMFDQVWYGLSWRNHFRPMA